MAVRSTHPFLLFVVELCSLGQLGFRFDEIVVRGGEVIFSMDWERGREHEAANAWDRRRGRFHDWKQCKYNLRMNFKSYSRKIRKISGNQQYVARNILREKNRKYFQFLDMDLFLNILEELRRGSVGEARRRIMETIAGIHETRADQSFESVSSGHQELQYNDVSSSQGEELPNFSFFSQALRQVERDLFQRNDISSDQTENSQGEEFITVAVNGNLVRAEEATAVPQGQQNQAVESVISDSLRVEFLEWLQQQCDETDLN